MSTRGEPLATVREQARATLDRLREELIADRGAASHWTGELAASALSTATAVSAISTVVKSHMAQGKSGDPGQADLIRRGMEFLRGQQNSDGGFGDTDLSHSNIATSYLVLAASKLASEAIGASLSEDQRERLADYIAGAGEIEGLKARYGTDKTFVVPILTNMAIAGLVDWKCVSPLPFEAAVFPQSMYRFLRMPVVSYAIPALVAIGQARHFLGPKTWLPVRFIRSAAVSRTMTVLRRMQPDSGGYLEATPLTSFVLMSLAATGRADHAVATNSLKFLTESVLENGSWPIDTNLATWVTSLSIHALACDPDDDGAWCDDALVDWHLSCQHLQRHPFTGADPGGWGWTDLSGAVPDADDTPGALLALDQMKRHVSQEKSETMDRSIADGVRWLIDLQNRDGGWPTFCRGWGKLPFDRSSTDLTAHALRALHSASKVMTMQSDFSLSRAERMVEKAKMFLSRQQCGNGSWLPLWFGNQDLPDEINPVYGTAKVLMCGKVREREAKKAIDFLIDNVNPDGGWGGGPSLAPNMKRLQTICSSDSQRSNESDAELENFSRAAAKLPANLTSSVEETALAVEAIATQWLFRWEKKWRLREEKPAESPIGANHFPLSGVLSAGGDEDCGYGATESELAAILGGVQFLVQSVQDERHRVAWPIGFYFAKLWYHERLYPLIFAVAALGKFLRATAEQYDPEWPR